MRNYLLWWLTFFCCAEIYAQQTGAKDGSLVIDFSKKKGKAVTQDTVPQLSGYDLDKAIETPSESPTDKKMRQRRAIKDYALFNGLFYAGMNACQVDGDNLSGYYYLGAHGGIGTLIRFHPYLSTSLEMQYSMKGAQDRFQVNDPNIQNRLKIVYDYVEVLPTLNMHYENLFQLGIGPALGFMVRYKETDPGGLDITNSQFNIKPRKIDLSMRLQITFYIKECIGLGGGFQYTVLSLRPPLPGTRVNGTFNNLLNLRASFLLRGKKH